MRLSQKANVSRFRLCMAEGDCLQLPPDELDAINQALKPEMQRAARIASEFQGATVTEEQKTEQRKTPVAAGGKELSVRYEHCAPAFRRGSRGVSELAPSDLRSHARSRRRLTRHTGLDNRYPSLAR